MKALGFLLSSMFIAGALIPSVQAKTVTVSQKDKKFLIDGKPADKLKIKAGDTVVFVNDDSASHNVFSTSDGMKFNLKIQKPKQQGKHKFEAKGSKGTIRCAIHPKMKMEVQVD